nr:uncharacterized protein LOC129263643 [Lytechinus pictus]
MACQGECGIKYNILNEPISALKLATELQRCIMKIKALCMSEDGSGVDYFKLGRSDLFLDFTAKTRELSSIDLRPLTSDQRKAFFINIYNALTIHALAVQPELPRTVLEVQDFWKTSSYLIAGQVYSLDDIEHGILRRNKPHPSTKKSCFHDDDPRLAYMVDTLDARIHFALNCGAESCPPISVYTEQNLERALDMAAKNYLNQEITMDIDSKQINLPSLLKWYGSDAAETDIEVVRWTIPFLDGEKAAQVQELITGSEVTVGYRPYSWKLNNIQIGEEFDDSGESKEKISKM